MLTNHNPLPAQVAAPAPGAPTRGRYPDVPDGVAIDAFYAGPTHDRDVLVLVASSDGLNRLHLLGEISFDRSDARLLVDRDRTSLGAGIPVEVSERLTPQHPLEQNIHDTSSLELAALSTAMESSPDTGARHRAAETTPLAPPPADPLDGDNSTLYDKIKLDFEQQLSSFQLPTV